MIRVLLSSLLVTIALCSVYRGNKPIYRNLYGFERDGTPFMEALLNSAAGGLNFLRDGAQFLSREIEDSTPTFDQDYDFIVVGAGSAGATVAARLSEVDNVTVLLIEAGRTESLLMDIPVLVNYFQFNNDINWKYQTESSNSYCRGMVDQKCNIPRGKVMGGSSVLNYMIATRGFPFDYDRWSEMGNEGWSYAELLKYFKKLEDIGIPELRDDSKMHNTNGPMHIEYPTFHTPLAESFLDAGIEMGYPIVDYNSKGQAGFSYIQATMKNGTRMSSNRAYLHPINKRKNLFVTRHSHVNKVLINLASKTAYGVEFTKSAVNIRVRARKEIVLCAGAIGSAQILMLSGIGPSKHLKKMKINVIQDVPVGENLMDHIAYGGLIFLVDQPVGIVTSDLTNPVKPYLHDFFERRFGPLTVPGGCEALAFVDVDNPGKVDTEPNMELLFIGSSLISDFGIRYNMGISDEYWTKMFAKVAGNYSWMIFPMLMRPKSKGRILLRSNDPNDKPKIIPNYLEDPEDVRIMIKGIKMSIELSKTKAMQQFNSKFYDIPVPHCENYTYGSDEYWECAARTYTFTIYHQSGTCKMAPETDPTGVVNPRLQVKGIKGLRVADASIMPNIITGHTNIPTIMIGEKLADMVKEDWNYI